MTVFPNERAWSGNALLTRADEAEQLGAGANTVRLLADGSTTDGAISANRTRLAAGVEGPPPHFHNGSAEIFFVIEGVAQALAGDRVLTLEKGDFLVVPKSMPHAFATPAGSAADLLIVFAPGMQDRSAYFRLIDRVTRGRASPNAAQRSGIMLVTCVFVR
ncbi:cupin domain-containing protein [Actinospica robiniae]|uniref:cupin domain-containing protein n=1 Tax=Actinospica robiniae TaxID=304901 RepID=UPI0004106FE0|nr:cupin domain-containing protein [Actinospica robiniae]